MESISVKGGISGLQVVIPTAGAWSERLDQLQTHLREAANFWKGARTTLDLGERVLELDELRSLVDLLRDSYGLQQISLVAEEKPLQDLAREAGVDPVDRASMLEARRPSPSPVSEGDTVPVLPGANAMVVRQTVRSGQRIHFPGHLVIFGDVNAGAEIFAGGDIMVFGTFRGIAHAGYPDSTDARIGAVQLRPMQLRIGPVIARSPDAGVPPAQYPEVARVEQGEIRIDRL
ncbi:MAG: septum site-determining protein MinC [bacterium]|nr:septum site-determining protein MinC [bacterium]